MARWYAMPRHAVFIILVAIFYFNLHGAERSISEQNDVSAEPMRTLINGALPHGGERNNPADCLESDCRGGGSARYVFGALGGVVLYGAGKSFVHLMQYSRMIGAAEKYDHMLRHRWIFTGALRASGMYNALGHWCRGTSECCIAALCKKHLAGRIASGKFTKFSQLPFAERVAVRLCDCFVYPMAWLRISR